MGQVAKAHQVKRDVVDDLADIANIAIERAEKERARSKALEAVLQEAVACDFSPGEWQEKARQAVEGER
jgi:hypothetical protein